MARSLAAAARLGARSGARPSAPAPRSTALAHPRRSLARVGARRAASQDDLGSSEPGTPRSEQISIFSNGEDGAVAVSAAPAPAKQPNLFLEPLTRNFLLGIGAGISCEALHVAYKFLTANTNTVTELLSSDALRPLFVADHAVAIGCWLLLYAVEAAAIVSVLRQFNDDARSAAPTVRSMPTLPKRMFPASLNSIKAGLYRAARRIIPAASAAAFPFSRAPAAGPAAGAATAAAASPFAALFAASPLSTTDEEASGAAPGDVAAASFSAATALAEPKTRDAPSAAPPKLSRSLERALKEIAALPEAPEKRRGGKGPGDDSEDEDDQGMTRRDRELLERKSYLKNFWYAAALSDNLKPGQPLGVDILGTRVVLFRDQETGKISCLDDACPHRGAPLSAGWLQQEPSPGAQGGAKKTCVVCPYHGWAFDGEGRLRDVPSAESQTWPKRPILGSYAVEERGGFVWLFYGDPHMPADERPPIPFTPELEDPNWRAVYGEIEFDAGHWGVFDNAIDMAHIHYLHGDSFGNKDKPRIMDMTTSRDAFSCTAKFRIHNKPVNKLWEWTAVPSVPVTAQAMLPSSSNVTITLAHGVSMITFVNTVPISADRAINRFCLIRNFALSPAFDRIARNNMYKILGEDKVMVDRLKPEACAREVSLAPDAPQLAFRKLRAEWAAMGYLVPPESKDRPRRGLLDDGGCSKPPPRRGGKRQ